MGTPIVIAACSLILLQLQEVLGQGHFLNSMCGMSYPARTRGKIMHGTDATIGSAPFMAYLMRHGELFCGGTIINQRYILTAAHCIKSGMTVRLGEYDNRTNPDCAGRKCFFYEDFAIEAVSRHKNYNAQEYTNDIALLKLARNIQFKSHILPVCLLLNPANAPYRRELQAFGWGKTHLNGYSSVLQTTKLNRYSNSHCAERLNIRALTNNQICLVAQGSDTCSGDSGGPLVTQVELNGVSRYLQLGIVSFGDEICAGPGVYTYVPNYIGWIQNVIKRLGYYSVLHL